MPDKKKIQVAFYKTPAGNEPVRVWLKELPAEEKKLDTDLWEVRTILPNRISRVFFTVWKGFIVLLHSIIKKSQKTPKEDLDLAKKRRNEVLKGGVSDEK